MPKCKHLPIDSGATPIGSTAVHPIISRIVDIIYATHDLRHGPRLVFSSTPEMVMLGVSTQVFDFPINSGATDMGIPFGYPLLVYLARPNMEKTQYGEKAQQGNPKK